MSEQHPVIVEKAPSSKAENHPILEPKTERTDAEHEAARQETLEQSRQEIERSAAKTESIKVGEAVEEPLQHAVVTKDLQDMAYQRILVRTRKKLAVPDRVFSRVIHQPIVNTLSTMGEKTIARPSGVLAGGFCALLGSSVLLYTAKHYGFHYNFLIFALLFVGGFGLGLILELLFSLVRKAKH